MSNIPRSVLSEKLQAHMKGRRLRVGVFLTYCFDPGFFEREILPVFIDTALSPAPTMRTIQLEDAIRDSVEALAVYYDRNALEPGAQSSKLDVRRIGVTRPHGYVFHPKNVFAVVEDVDSDDDGHRGQHLIVACLSANLTQGGWWENVEACHIESVAEGGACGFRDDVLDLIKHLRAQCRPDEDHSALDAVERFVKRSVTQRAQRSQDGVLYPRVYSGRDGVVEFLSAALGSRADGANLEVISPYFGNTDVGPLGALIARFAPRETRVFLPRDDAGAAGCTPQFSKAVEATGASWAELPKDVLKRGGDVHATLRFVHAKVYRFFSRTKRFEAVFVGSANLTAAAHIRGRNFETGFLVESAPTRPPEWWLTGVDAPRSFGETLSGEASDESRLTPLRVRFNWSAGLASFTWDATSPPPEVSVSAQGAHVFSGTAPPAGEWRDFPPDASARLADVLKSTSFLTVTAPGESPATILVQEDGMAAKPSLLQTLSAADILHYWSLLTAEQRAAFLEERGTEIAAVARELGIEVRPPSRDDVDSIFSTFAGIYHAFGTLERALRKDIGDARFTGVEYRLLGKKHDSLGNLLARLDVPAVRWSTVERYVVVLCARQLFNEVRSLLPAEFKVKHRASLRDLDALIDASRLKHRAFEFDGPETRERFLDWFEQRFLARAHLPEETL